MNNADSDHDGRFDFWTVRPMPYPIPDDRPVGRVLAALGRHPWRPAGGDHHHHYTLDQDFVLG